jgi:hypothetical protein
MWCTSPDACATEVQNAFRALSEQAARRSTGVSHIERPKIPIMAGEQVSDTWERGNSDEQYVGRWSRRVAPAFLARLDIPPARRWLDVGCRTGARCAAIGRGSAPAYAMSLDEVARANLRERLRLRIRARADGSRSPTARTWAIRATVADREH